MEMINKDVRDALIASGLPDAQAETISLLVPDWSQFATKTDLERMESRLSFKMLMLVSVPIASLIVAFLIAYTLNTLAS